MVEWDTVVLGDLDPHNLQPHNLTSPKVLFYGL